jgi:hypothetical protein
LDYDQPFHINLINTNDLLLGPIFILDLPPVFKKNTWKILDVVSPTQKELTIPDFKDC